MAKLKKCVVDGCDNHAYYKESQLCQCCYQAFRYWQQRTPTQVIRRRRNLAKYEARLDMLLCNVTTLAKRKSA